MDMLYLLWFIVHLRNHCVVIISIFEIVWKTTAGISNAFIKG